MQYSSRLGEFDYACCALMSLLSQTPLAVASFVSTTHMLALLLSAMWLRGWASAIRRNGPASIYSGGEMIAGFDKAVLGMVSR
jgi:hypothetical protein